MPEDNDESKPQESSKKLDTTVQVAIITVTGGIITALVTAVIAPIVNESGEKAPTSTPNTSTSVVGSSSPSTSLSPTASSDGEDCDRHLQEGLSYKNSHTGGLGQVFGDITITRTYQCQEGTCFSARMSFDTNQADDADGFWLGSHFEITRYLPAHNTSQIWSGKCLTNSVNGNWYFTDRERQADRGQFWINY